MFTQRRLSALFAVTVVVATAAVLVHRRRAAEAPVRGAGQPMLARLLRHVDDVREIHGSGPDGSFTLRQIDHHWVVADRHDYPAKQREARALIIGLAELTRVEPKTDDPTLYRRVGLAPLSAKARSDGANSHGGFEYVLRDAAGHALASLLVGMHRPAVAHPQLEAYFVRRPSRARVWLVDGNLPPARSAGAWLDTRLLPRTARRLTRIALHLPGATPVVLRREKHTESRAVEWVSASRERGDGSILAAEDLAELFREMNFAKAAPLAARAFAGPVVFDARLHTVTGLRIRILARRVAGKVWATLTATPVAGDPEPAPDAAMKRRSASLAHRLNALWSRWVYRLAPHRVTAIIAHAKTLERQRLSG